MPEYTTENNISIAADESDLLETIVNIIRDLTKGGIKEFSNMAAIEERNPGFGNPKTQRLPGIDLGQDLAGINNEMKSDILRLREINQPVFASYDTEALSKLDDGIDKHNYRDEHQIKVDSDFESRIDNLPAGQPLSESERNFYESRFGADFEDVRIHTGADANELAKGINAKAFTKGKDIVFAEGEYAPGTEEGKKLMAHELGHVVEQRETESIFKESDQKFKNEICSIDTILTEINPGAVIPSYYFINDVNVVKESFKSKLEEAEKKNKVIISVFEDIDVKWDFGNPKLGFINLVLYKININKNAYKISIKNYLVFPKDFDGNFFNGTLSWSISASGRKIMDNGEIEYGKTSVPITGTKKSKSYNGSVVCLIDKIIPVSLFLGSDFFKLYFEFYGEVRITGNILKQ